MGLGSEASLALVHVRVTSTTLRGPPVPSDIREVYQEEVD